MMNNLFGFYFILTFIYLVLGSIVDLKIREVPDYLSYSLLFFGFSFSILLSIVYNDFSFIVSSLLGFSLCFVIACTLFYSGQWGGGDAKMLMALGALFGLSLDSLYSFNYLDLSTYPYLLVLVLLIFLLGSVYGVFWLTYLIIRHRHAFWKEYRIVLSRRLFIFSILFGFALAVSSFFFADVLLSLVLLLSGILLVLLTFSYPMVTLIEKIAFVQKIPVSRLTVGDWLAKPVRVGKKIIAPVSSLGLSKKEFDVIVRFAKQGKVKEVYVKYGIPFLPSFLLALVFSLFFLL